jgi:hypothetical protein
MAVSDRFAPELARVGVALSQGRVRSVVLLWEDADGRMWEACEIEGHPHSLLQMIGQVSVTQSRMNRAFDERFSYDAPDSRPNPVPVVLHMVPKEPN